MWEDRQILSCVALAQRWRPGDAAARSTIQSGGMIYPRMFLEATDIAALSRQKLGCFFDFLLDARLMTLCFSSTTKRNYAYMHAFNATALWSCGQLMAKPFPSGQRLANANGTGCADPPSCFCFGLAATCGKRLSVTSAWLLQFVRFCRHDQVLFATIYHVLLDYRHTGSRQCWRKTIDETQHDAWTWAWWWWWWWWSSSSSPPSEIECISWFSVCFCQVGMPEPLPAQNLQSQVRGSMQHGLDHTANCKQWV